MHAPGSLGPRNQAYRSMASSEDMYGSPSAFLFRDVKDLCGDHISQQFHRQAQELDATRHGLQDAEGQN